MNPGQADRWRWLPWGLIPLAVLAIYWPALNGGLLMDDAEHITPPALRSFAGLWRIWTELGATPHYYPVLNTVFWLEHRLWQEAPLGYHLANGVQHAAAACLVVLLVRRLRLAGAALAGLLFAVHPVHVESVAWIPEQKNTLSTLFALGAALVYLDYGENRRKSRYALASGLFLLALLTKTVVAVVPPALWVIAWWRHGRLEARRDILPLLPWLVVGAGLGLFSAWFEQVHSHAQGADFNVPWSERTLIAVRAVVFYVRTLAWPADLMFINPRWVIAAEPIRAYASLGGALAVTAGLVWLAKKSRGPLAAWLLYVGMLFPVLGFLNINWFNFSYVADHFQYLPSLGLTVPFAAWLDTRLRRADERGALAVIVSALLVSGLALAAWNHARDFRSAEALYTRTLEKNPACWLAHNNLGTIRLEQPDGLSEAIRHFSRAVELKPDHARAHANLGFALAGAGRPAEALPHQVRAVELQGSVAEPRLNLGLTLAAAGAISDAIVQFDEAIRLKPDYVDAHIARADALARLPDKIFETIAAYRSGLALAPGRPELHLGLAMALAAEPGQRGEAIAHVRAALRLNPSFAEAYNNLGTLLAADAATLAEAIAMLTKATELAPDYFDARFNLGVLLANLPGRRGEALAQLEQAARLRPDDPEVRSLLAALQATR